ncbi:hypothetical protein BDP27DRAFT_1319007 [Rhodocollybia butyracea]|uniref:Secreted protein n=1 Tax=Rhodocollybia butyracea TaxID=206335 RepID=A0A9P5Q1Y8_9AGAR|nr:hypothetical protein BDP27DRAFT_1319007 [Rhodocollybia butyracea]
MRHTIFLLGVLFVSALCSSMVFGMPLGTNAEPKNGKKNDPLPVRFLDKQGKESTAKKSSTPETLTDSLNLWFREKIGVAVTYDNGWIEEPDHNHVKNPLSYEVTVRLPCKACVAMVMYFSSPRAGGLPELKETR